MISIGDANFQYLVKVVLARLFQCEASIFLFQYSVLWKQASYFCPYKGCREWGVIKLHFLEWDISTYIIWDSCVREIWLLIYLFNYFIISVWTHVHLISTLCYSPIRHYLHCCSNCSGFGHWELFQVGSWVPLTWPHPFVFMRTSLLSGTTRCSRLFFLSLSYHSTPATSLQLSPILLFSRMKAFCDLDAVPVPSALGFNPPL